MLLLQRDNFSTTQTEEDNYARLKNNDPSLSILTLKGSKITKIQILQLAIILQNNFTLLTLFIQNTRKISLNGFKELCKCLTSNSVSKLTYLHITSCNIGNNGAIILSKMIRLNSSLSQLDISSNGIGNDGIVALSHAIKFNKSLTELGLECNRIEDDGVKILLEYLKYNKHLEFVWLGNNKVGIIGATTVRNFLMTTRKHLVYIDMVGNPVNDKDLMKSIQHMLDNREYFEENCKIPCI